jgi:hypothetical protein
MFGAFSQRSASMEYLPVLVMVGFAVLGLASLVLWVFALVDCLSNEPSNGNDKIVWILVILFASGIGALIYLLVRRPQRISQYGR